MSDGPPFDSFYTSQALEDLEYWSKTDKRIRQRIDRLIADTLLHPFTGLGKPEPLRHQLAGYWSRRITSPSAGFTTDFISSAGNVAAQNTVRQLLLHS